MMLADTAKPEKPLREFSLNDVRAVIPESCYGRSTGRAATAIGIAAALYALPLAALAATDRWWVLLICWPLAGLGVAGLFVLGHDASHGVLVTSPRLNRLLARLLMGPSLHAEAAWDLGHNRIHHGYTARQGFDFVWHPTTGAEYQAMNGPCRVRHRLEWSMLGAGAYYLRSVWWDKMWHFSPPGKRQSTIRRDKVTLASAALAIVVAVATPTMLGGRWLDAMWLIVKLFVVPFLIFIQIIGWTVYVHHIAPDIRWRNRREWTQYKGQMESTTVIRIPALVNRLWFHNIFVHVPHHVDTRIRFDHLPRAAAAIAAAHKDAVRSTRMSIRGYLRTTRACKLYDFETGQWSTYAEQRT
jgi:omega-6 fatty acid desaturase (delta-12 desaturase)